MKTRRCGCRAALPADPHAPLPAAVRRARRRCRFRRTGPVATLLGLIEPSRVPRRSRR